MLPLLVALQIAGLATALAALFLDLHYAILVAGVIIFLLGGRLVRRQLDRSARARDNTD